MQVWALLWCIVAEASLLDPYNTSNYIGRIQATYSRPAQIGDWLGYSNNLAEPATENKATFGVPGSVINLFFNIYEQNNTNGTDCADAYAAIGFSASQIKSMATAYSNGDQYFTYLLIPTSTVIAAPSLWDNVFYLAQLEYEAWSPQPSFNLTALLYQYLPTFQTWASQLRACNSPFPNLYAADVGNMSFHELTSNPNYITTAQFFGLSTPSDVATRAWLCVKFGLFPEFMGDGYTLQANHSVQGLPEVIMNNRQINASDVLIPLTCSGNGFVGLPGSLSAVVRVFDSFDLYADGTLVTSVPTSCSGEDVVVNLNQSTNLIGIHAKALVDDAGLGILATVGSKMVSNASWFCQRGFDVSWTKFGYNFLTWAHATAVPQGIDTGSDLVTQNPNAMYIWTSAMGSNTDQEVYCTINLKTYSAAPATSSALPIEFCPLLLLILPLLHQVV